MCRPARKIDRVASALLAVGLLVNFIAMNFMHAHDAVRGLLEGFGLGLELVAVITIVRRRRSSAP